MTHRALVFDPDVYVEPRYVEFEPEHLDRVLRAALGVSALDHTRQISTPMGMLVAWVGDGSLMDGSPLNPRASFMTALFGYGSDHRGPVALTGGVRPDGWHEGISAEMAAAVDSVTRQFDQYLASRRDPKQ